ncbi:hypothetical protein EJ05DRAFT_498360 [Pseudovirgaria hyperparasitica]|uniref:mannan endo-1,6-alpha-mannosidase n=1 Tax=Pseudovirgaria hyperparasitica TaxID=470096 RepID=A0A6A6WCG3_9PEZI|nr:uncharacterized protein EJ05DRAFT_498360 [Pseudovirgaria hyperparasitica]KAF2760403.1 hypothetical protein EJ05DRAFT_498360 [Pseudovirgaria hyperparasitica]
MKQSIIHPALVASALFISSCASLKLSATDGESVRNAAATVAYGLMSHYTNNQSTTPAADVGSFVSPEGVDKLYWWNSGAIWGGMVDYAMYSGDNSYVEATKHALAANVGEKADLIIESKRGEEGTDDQAFWALSMMSAAESGFPAADGAPAYIDVAEGAFKSITSRWDTTSCNGGLFWQIYADNANGLKYKNSVANGGLFQLAARLALHKKDDSFANWAEKVWDWTTKIGFIDSNYAVYDGAGTENGANCAKIDHNRWTYNHGLFTYGAAAMYAHTGNKVWLERTQALVKAADYFFNHHSEAPGVLAEVVCEQKTCNMDQQSFKAYLSRWLGKTAKLVPETASTITPWLKSSAEAAAQSCSGDKNQCGTKWYTGGFDGLPGINQQLCALETIQSLMLSIESKGDHDQGSDAKSSIVPTPSPTPSPSPAVPEPSIVASSSHIEEPVQFAPTAVDSIAPTPAAPTPYASPAVPAPSEASDSVCEEPVVVTVTETGTVTMTVEPTAEVLPTSVCETPVVVTVTVTSSSFAGVEPTSIIKPTTAVVSSHVSAPAAPSSPPVPTAVVPPVPAMPTSGFVVPTGHATPSPLPFDGAASKRSAASAVFTVAVAALMLFL